MPTTSPHRRARCCKTFLFEIRARKEDQGHIPSIRLRDHHRREAGVRENLRYMVSTAQGTEQ